MFFKRNLLMGRRIKIVQLLFFEPSVDKITHFVEFLILFLDFENEKTNRALSFILVDLFCLLMRLERKRKSKHVS